MTILHVSR